MNVLLLNGPNLNMLGRREPDIYGSQTLEQVVAELTERAGAMGVTLSHQQSNAEHDIIDAIHNAISGVDAIIINPGAWTHTSVALRDALLSVNVPFFEVHLSNIYAREPFRHHSYLSDKASGVLCGFGVQGYDFALQAAVRLCR